MILNLPNPEVNLSEGMLFNLRRVLALSMANLSIDFVLFDIFLSYLIPNTTKFFRIICSSSLKRFRIVK